MHLIIIKILKNRKKITDSLCKEIYKYLNMNKYNEILKFLNELEK